MQIQFLVLRMQTRFEKEQRKYSGPRKINVRFFPSLNFLWRATISGFKLIGPRPQENFLPIPVCKIYIEVMRPYLRFDSETSLVSTFDFGQDNIF